MRTLLCAIDAVAVEARGIFYSKLIPIILCAALLALACFSAASAQNKPDAQGKQEQQKKPDVPSTEPIKDWNQLLTPVLSLIQNLLDRPPPFPELKCATPEQEEELRRLSKDWESAWMNWKKWTDFVEESEEYVAKMQDELKQLQQKLGRVPSSADLAKAGLQGYPAQIADYKLYISQKVERMPRWRKEVTAASEKYYKLLNSIPKECPPPKANINIPGGGRFAPRMLPPSQVLTMGSGVYGGGGFGTLATVCPTWTTTGVNSFGAFDPVKQDDQACTTSGFLTSIYVGYQLNLASNWIVGIETSFGYATNKATTGVPGVSSAPGDNINVKEDWSDALLARFGYMVTPRTSVYATTGVAFQHIEANVTCTGTSPNPCGRFGPVAPMTATNAPTLRGWTLGAGAEYALTGALRLRGEYRYSDYGTYNATYGNPANVAVSSGIRLRTNTALMGLSFAFGGGASAAAVAAPSDLISK